ncbi:MAG: hypothetical protein IT454_20065 [Planctomycetes bacterium]|nr:hypothetical protein [Planctomycetota bacterium]
MSEFHETRMGRVFHEVTLPKLIEQLARLNESVERLAKAIEADAARAERDHEGNTSR